MKKVMLILVDGMRPDALGDIESAQKYAKCSAYAPAAQTVLPSSTLPCHMSLFHSVDPSRHGTTTNTYAPQVRPISGLCEAIREGSAKKMRSALFYNWEPLRDLSRPSIIAKGMFFSGIRCGWEETNEEVTQAAIESLKKDGFDFMFVYLGWLDEAGHADGWLSDEYMRALRASWDCIDRLTEAAPEEYTVIVTADHGGHDRTHGTDLKEDMTIPIFFRGPDFEPNTVIENASIKDIAPTVLKILGIEAFRPDEWEGKELI